MIQFLLAAPRSGSGKTTMTCALLMALKRRGCAPCAFKSGPDYIDPMFHRAVLGAESRSLDLFFSAPETVRTLYAKGAAGHGAAVCEGAMGFYDGLGGVSDRASAWHLADTLDLPVLLVVEPKGQSLTLAAELKGLVNFRTPSHIAGILLNNCTARMHALLAPMLEKETGLPVLGFLPKLPEAVIGSRHLGLYTAAEVENLQQKLALLADAAEEHIDWPRLLALCEKEPPALPVQPETPPARVRIAVAQDEAFCFTYAETLESLRDYSPAVDDILKYRTYSKLLSTYVDGLLKALGPDGRIHSTFIQTEARTGRISSTEPNLQNIPIRTELGSRLRGYFVAAPGETLVDADYSQIELRILAHITGDEAMQQAFLSGADIHRATAAKIYHIPESDVTHELRTSAKAINFGIMYGKGAYSLSKDIGVSVKEAEAFLQTYLATFPNIDGYMEKTIADARQCGYVSTLFGRRRALPELASSNFNVRSSGERMARNTPIQGTAADVIKLAMVRVWKRLRNEKMESRLILTVHDELIVEAPQAEAEKAAQILREEMEGCVHYAVPLSTDVHTGKNWLEAH